MIRLLVWLLLIYIGYRIIQGLAAPKKSPDDGNRDRFDAETTHRDPVCGVYVTEEDAVIGRLDGQRHYFCSMSCLEKYRDQLDHTS